MSAELAHFKCGRCSVVGHQTPDCILGYAQLWQSTVKVVLGYHNCSIPCKQGVLGYPLLWYCASTCPFCMQR